MTESENITPVPAENRNPKKDYDEQVAAEEGDLNDIDSPIYNGPAEDDE